MTPNVQAKEIVNEIYQPLGYLSCNVSPNEMWEYAKKIAVKQVQFCIDQYDKDQYKRKTDYLENLIIEINKL